ncbi:MAG: UDP-N-acetylmuramoyl-L-alanyl-D-glutamate--2,6-diaminopimelate ligase [Candidatus Paracaedibacteraceae bacterium]|nr:UDP-N-acetylmuramoyl-L-alanyl-D-glutamate--2,6-diaminopimelate ligase [Candidatus Paracaedibacteraceae bacterium]
MRLSKILTSVPVNNMGDIDITRFKLSTKNIKRGDVYLNLEEKDETLIHNNFLEAIKRGASCIITSFPSIGINSFDTPIILVDNVRKILSEVASNFYPQAIKNIVGVTGTCGKTSTVSFIRQLLNFANHKSASLGTEGIWIGNQLVSCIPQIITTPPVLHLHYILNYLSSKSVTDLAMEVTSHGLDRNRVDNIPFNVGLFTNLIPTHLDYHLTMEHYYSSKRRFFSEVLSNKSTAVINSEEGWSSDISSICAKRKIQTILVGKDIRLINVNFLDNQTEIDVNYFGNKIKIFLPSLATYQIENFLFSIGALTALGIDINIVQKFSESLQSPPGRMELIHKMPNGALIFIDYAHRPETFEKILKPLYLSGRDIVLVFGCGGGIYKDRRRKMGVLADKYAKKVIITDDNARDEDPAGIRKMILEGCQKGLEISNRREAIYNAIKFLEPNNVCLILGKGTEDFQIIGNKKIKFNDKTEALNIVKTIVNQV